MDCPPVVLKEWYIHVKVYADEIMIVLQGKNKGSKLNWNSHIF